MEPPNHVIISKKSTGKSDFQKLYARYVFFFMFTIFLLVPIFYQLILSQKFWEQSSIFVFFVLGVYGYVFLIVDVIQTNLKGISGFISENYKKNETKFNYLVLILLIIISIPIFFFIFGLSYLASMATGLLLFAITWWIDHKIAKKTDESK